MAVGASDPTVALTTDQLNRASARWMFVKEDLDNQPLGVLAERCRQAVTSGDKVEAVLHLRAARQKLGNLSREEQYDRARYEVKAVVEELEAVVLDVERRDQAKAVLDAANTLACRAGSMSYFMSSGQEHLLGGGAEDIPAR